MRPPIPEPNGVLHNVREIPEKVRVFRWKPWPNFWLSVIGMQWITPILCFILLQGPQTGPLADGVLGIVSLVFILGFGFACITTPVLYFTTPVRLKRYSLMGSSFWGRKTEVSWNAITGVWGVKYLWCEYLRVEHSSDGAALWLPLYLKDRSGFEASVREFADTANPLLRYFEGAEGRG